MAAVDLERDRTAPGQPEKMRAAHRERLEPCRGRIRVVGHPPAIGNIRRPSGAWRVPGQYSKLTGQAGELSAPGAAIIETAVQENERCARAGLTVREPDITELYLLVLV